MSDTSVPLLDTGETKTSWRVTASFIVFFILIFASFYMFIQQNSERVQKNNSGYAEETIIQTAKRIEDQFDSSAHFIKMSAFFISASLTKPSVPLDLMKKMESNSPPFDKIHFITAEGKHYSYEFGEEVCDNAHYYKDAFEGKSGVKVIFHPGVDEIAIISFYSPIYFKDKVIGVLCGIFDTAKYLRQVLATSYFEDSADVFLCLPNGEIVGSAAKINFEGNVLEALTKAKIIDKATAEKGSQLFNKEDATVKCAGAGSTANLCVMQMPKYNFVLVQTFPESVTRRMIDNANAAGFKLAAILIALFLLQSAYLFWHYRAQRKKLEKQNYERGIVVEAINTLFCGRYALCDLESKTYKFIAGSKLEYHTLPQTGSYEDIVEYQAQFMPDINAREAFSRYFKADNIQRRLEKDTYTIYECEVILNGKNEWENLNAICVERKNGVPVKILFMRQFITAKKMRDLRLQEKILVMDRQERQYQLAVTANAFFTFELNVSKNLIDKDIIIKNNGKQESLLNLLELSVPCVGTELFCTMMSKILSESREDFSVLLDPDFLKQHYEKGEKEFDIEYWTHDPNGVEVCVRLSFYMTRDSRTNNIMAMVVGKDITSQVQRQRMENKALQDALAQARHANEAKSAFLSNMSHDIRTPMNAIIGFATIASSHINNREQVRDCLTKVLSSSNHLLCLINDILDMSRIESGKMQIKEQECNISELMHNLVNIIQPQVKAKQLQLFIDTFEVVNENIMADPLKLNQIFINLLGNSVKYTPAGGHVAFSIRQGAAFKHGWADYIFEVSDSGIGMSEEFVEHIFEPFTRETTTTQSGIQGTGLGMAITKNIIDMMNGKIEVWSEVGKGSRFTVTLTLKIIDQAATDHAIEELKGIRVLVVDDDFNICDSVSKMLTEIGIRSEWTTSGREAAQRAGLAYRDKDPFNTYIIDWHMPDMNGVETARSIRKAVGEDAPIIILTAYDWSEVEEEAREAGVTAFCSKPLFMSDLRNALLTSHKLLELEKSGTDDILNFGQRRLLLVDDLELNREIAEFILTEKGFLVEMAPDGTDAVEMVKSSKEGYYDAILMDVQMPVMNGYEATRTIRGLDRKDVKTMPIIAMTANALEEDKFAALKAGMNAHISKPIDIDKFFETMREFFGDSQDK